MVVSVTASTTQGSVTLLNLHNMELYSNLKYCYAFRKPLDSAELDRVMEACNIALDLDKCKSKIYTFVESRMAYIAPNLSILVGAPIAAKLMGNWKFETH